MKKIHLQSIVGVFGVFLVVVTLLFAINCAQENTDDIALATQAPQSLTPTSLSTPDASVLPLNSNAVPALTPTQTPDLTLATSDGHMPTDLTTNVPATSFAFQTPTHSSSPPPAVTSTPAPTPTKEELTCSVLISCATILDNIDDLAAGKEEYVPTDGIILQTTVVIENGESVFDAIERACDQNGIHFDYEYTAIYDAVYIRGINHLYEKDCGLMSGWLIKVNGVFYNVSSSALLLNDGDMIEVLYTCEFGYDLG